MINKQISNLWFHKGHLNEDQRNFLIDIVSQLKPQYCLETGFASGRSCITVYFTAQPIKMISVDANLDYINGARNHSEIILSQAPNLILIEENSTKLDFVKLKQDHFDNNHLDFAFVDGSHSYEGCYTDLTNILKIAKKGTMIIVDDYESGPPNGCSIISVNKAVDDFVKSNKLSMEKWYCKGKGFAIIII